MNEENEASMRRKLGEISTENLLDGMFTTTREMGYPNGTDEIVFSCSAGIFYKTFDEGSLLELTKFYYVYLTERMESFGEALNDYIEYEKKQDNPHYFIIKELAKITKKEVI